MDDTFGPTKQIKKNNGFNIFNIKPFTLKRIVPHAYILKKYYLKLSNWIEFILVYLFLLESLPALVILLLTFFNVLQTIEFSNSSKKMEREIFDAFDEKKTGHLRRHDLTIFQTSRIFTRYAFYRFLEIQIKIFFQP